ncbi:MAG: hypothetical protein MUF81_02050, partial [Verrucomicrobia bacterium]|nr:hypothetical protein [Verrucomicrobiota bacterium]
MKYKFLSVLFGLALARAAFYAVPASGQPATFYVNDAVVNCPPDVPPQIDAVNFVNHSFFSINFTNSGFYTQLYDTANTLNFTNVGTMIGNNGFQFDTAPSGTGLRRMAASFYNPGTISAGSVVNTNNFFNFFFGLNLPKLLVSATNIVDPGTNIVGVDGWLRLGGKRVDLTDGTFTVEGLDDSTSSLNNFFFSRLGILTAYAAVGTNVMFPASQFENSPPSSPGNFGLTLPAAVVYIDDFAIGTNRFLSAVFLSDTNAAI